MRVPLTLLPSRDAAALAHAQALQSPCFGCADTPCCSYLPVHTFTVRTLVDLDEAAALAALERKPPAERPELYGGGRAAERVRDVVAAYTARV